MLWGYPRFSIKLSFRDILRSLSFLFCGEERGGDAVRFFERVFAEYTGIKYAVVAPAGRSALASILLSLDYEKGTEIVLSAYNYFVIPEIIELCGYKPVFVDIKEEDANIDPEKISPAITPRTRAILVTHMFGNPCDMDRIKEISTLKNLDIIEDCAHSCGSLYKDRMTGTFSKAAFFSFSYLKSPTTLGGGMVVTDNDELFKKFLKLRKTPSSISKSRVFKKIVEGAFWTFFSKPFVFSLTGYPVLLFLRRFFPSKEKDILGQVPASSKRKAIRDNQLGISAAQAYIGLRQMADIGDRISERRRNTDDIAGCVSGIPGVKILWSSENSSNCLYFNVLVDVPATVSAALLSRGIDATSSEFTNCARNNDKTSFTNTEYVARHILRLPNQFRYSDPKKNIIFNMLSKHVIVG